MGTRILHGVDGVAERFAAERRRAYTTITTHERRPARFLKQVVTMLLAMSSPEFGELHPDLRAFAQDAEWVGLPDRYQFYLTLYAGPIVRFVGAAGLMRNVGIGPIETSFVTELAYPPFAYVLSIDEATPVLETGNISGFADLKIEQTATVELQLITGYGHTVLPLDYRSRAAVEAEQGEQA